MKGSATLSTEAYIRKHLLCWFSPAKQSLTAESFAVDPRLLDLSGKGNDSLPFSNTPGIKDGYISLLETYPLKCPNLKALREFTLIIDAYRYYTAQNGGALAAKGNAFRMDTNDYGFRCSSYGKTVQINRSPFSDSRKMAIMTPYRRFNYGTKNSDTLGRGQTQDTISNLVVPAHYYGSQYASNIRLYELLLFDSTLTDEQIQWVVDNLINAQ